MAISLSNESKSKVSLSNEAKLSNKTWDEAEETWDEADYTWNQPELVLNKETKGTKVSLNNETK